MSTSFPFQRNKIKLQLMAIKDRIYYQYQCSTNSEMFEINQYISMKQSNNVMVQLEQWFSDLQAIKKGKGYTPQLVFPS